MNSIYLAGALSLVIDCDDLSLQSNRDQWQSQVCSQLQSDFDDVRLTAIKLNRHSVNSASEVRKVVIGNIMAGRLKVDVIDDDPLIQSRYLFSVNATRDVWVAKNKMYKGEVIDQDDLVLKKINVAPFIGLKTFLQEHFQGQILTRTIKKNEIVFADYLETKKLITQKQTIDLLIISGSLQIKTKGQAMESADKEGDKIKVKVIETGAILTGVVEGKENVYVEI
jgi:flagella basal body P-ring formation protein FlgA